MEYKYQVGDEVTISYKDHTDYGRRVRITSRFPFSRGAAYVTERGSWSEYNLRPAPPISPFEADLRDYISHEKKGLGL